MRSSVLSIVGAKRAQSITQNHLPRYFSTTITRAALPRIPLYIGGKAVDSSSGGTVTKHHVKTGEPSCEVVVAGEEETSNAIMSSKEAFGTWRDTQPYERRKVILKALDLLKDRFDDLRTALLADVSMSEISIAMDRKSSAALVEGAAQTALSLKGLIPPTADGAEVITTREPFGPVLSIPAFNFPMTLGLRSIVDPLACGNTVIFKSSLHIPQMHNLFHSIFAHAGLPAGALQILHYSEKDVAGRVEQMIAHPEVRMVNFTGSTKLGRILAAQCGKHLKPSIMELGGKSAAIVLDSADIKLAANNILFGALFNSGQVCMSTERVLVHESVTSALEAEMMKQWNEVKDKEFDVVRQESIGEVEGMVEEALGQGAKRLTPSSASSQILTNLTPKSSIWENETFSPMLTLTSFSSQSDLLSKLNSVPTGLSASIFGETPSAVGLAKRVDCGAVHINGMTIHDEASLPFGGVRDSGWGRYNGQGAVEGFTWMKHVRIVRDAHALPLGAL